MSITVEQIQSVTGRGKVVTDAGDKVGDIGQVYLNDVTGAPAWVTVKTGLFGSAESFVPLEGAELRGDDVVVVFGKDAIKDAPRIEADGSITPEEEQSLYRHYGLRSPSSTTEGSDAGVRSDVQTGGTGRTQDAVGTSGVQGTDQGVGQPARDGGDAMTRSEERLRVGTQTQVAGRAVLRKHIVTEYVTQTVPVRREEVRLERVPITDDNRGEIVDEGVAFGQDGDVFDMVLHQEVPVVQTETVAVERVRVRKDTVTEQVTVSDDVRKEKLELDDPTEQHRS